MSRKLISYYGGKVRMVEQLNKLAGSEIAKCEVYVEPCAGSASMAINLDSIIPEGKQIPKIHLNDKCFGVVILLKVLSDSVKSNELIQMLKNVKYGRLEWNKVERYKKNHYRKTPDKMLSSVEVAKYTYVEYNMSFNGCGKSFAEKRKNAEAAFERLKEQLKDIAQILNGAKVTRKDFLEVIDMYVENTKAFLNIDPPYLRILRTGGSNVYKYEFPNILDHIIMLRHVLNAECKVIIWGYKPWELIATRFIYDKVLAKSNKKWYCSKVGEYTKASANKKGKKASKGVEYIWHNFPIDDESLKKLNEEERQNVNIPLN